MTKIFINANHLLFHGTLEDFPAENLKAGFYDNVVWTAETPDVAQNYIPISGGSVHFNAYHFCYPTECVALQKLQKLVGIDYDYQGRNKDIKFRAGYHPDSFWGPLGWDDLPTEEEAKARLQDYKTEYDGFAVNTYYDENSKEQILLPGEKRVGRLFILQVCVPLKIFDMTDGGRIDGDLMDLQYHKVDTFRKLNEEGFDGVKINDFSQSKMHGNCGHRSIGLFNLAKVRISAIPATNFDWDEKFSIEITPEFTEYLKTHNDIELIKNQYNRVVAYKIAEWK